MPRSYQAYPQNAVITHSPNTSQTGDPSSAINAGANTFKVPSFLDACAGVTNGTANPFLSGLNTMGEGTGSTTNVNGQTGNILSGLQGFLDSLCGFASGGGSTGHALHLARQLRAEGRDVGETLEALRRLRDTMGGGTTPQSVLAGVSQVNDAVNASPMASGVVAAGQTDGSSGNTAIDAINGGQSVANSIFSILQLCGCGTQNMSGPLRAPLYGTDFNPYAPANVTPDIIIDAAQQVANTVAANPMAMDIISSGMPTASGNLGVAAVNGGVAAATAVKNDVSAASTLGQANAQAISLQAINNANYHAVDPTLNAVFNITSITGTTPDTITVTASNSVIGFVTIPTTTTKTFGVFIGYMTGTLTSAVVNVYEVDSISEVLTPRASSLNLVPDLSGSLDWIYAELQSDIPVTQAQSFAVELAVAGTGSLTIVGLPNHWLMAHPGSSVYPRSLAATRSTTAGTAAASMTSPTPSPNVPWLALSSVIPAPRTLTPATAALTLTAGSPVITYPGSPTLFMLVDKTSAASHTLTNVYGLVEYTGTAAAVWTLPAIAPNNGLVLFLKNSGTATVTVNCAGADHFDRPSGSASITLAPNASMTLTNDGVYWLSI